MVDLLEPFEHDGINERKWILIDEERCPFPKDSMEFLRRRARENFETRRALADAFNSIFAAETLAEAQEIARQIRACLNHDHPVGGQDVGGDELAN